jgi:integrase
MALAGLRVSEAASLRWRSVDLASGRLTVEASKTDAGRRVIGDLNPELVELLKVHRHASRFTEPRASCHDLRRSFCALAFAAGASPAAVMHALGHASAALSLEVYARVVAGATDGLGETMGKLVRGPDWAPMGTSGVDEQIGDEAASDAVFQEVAT